MSRVGGGVTVPRRVRRVSAPLTMAAGAVLRRGVGRKVGLRVLLLASGMPFALAFPQVEVCLVLPLTRIIGSIIVTEAFHTTAWTVTGRKVLRSILAVRRATPGMPSVPLVPSYARGG